MSYEIEEDSNEGPQAPHYQKIPTSATGGELGLQKQVQNIEEELQTIERTSKQVEKKMQDLKKAGPSEQQKIKVDITSIIDKLRSEKLQQISAMIASLNKAQSIANITVEQRTKYKAAVEKLERMHQQKCQQINMIYTSFQKLSHKVDTDITNQDPEQGIKDFQLKVLEEEMNEDLDGIISVHKEVNDINQLMQVMGAEVHKMDEKIDVIDNDVEDADKNVFKAEKNLQETRKSQKSKNKWLFIGLAAMAVTAGVVCLIVLL